MTIAVLTSESSWFVPFAQEFVAVLNTKGYDAVLFFEHEKITEEFEVVFILSYFRIIENGYLKRHKHNLVVHESALPSGKGWSPLFWQILEGKDRIPVVLFEVNEKIDEGDIYIADYILLKGYELNEEIRYKHAQKSTEMCLKFLCDYNILKRTKQEGVESHYPKRTPKDSELDIDKSIKEQFNLLRIVNNNDYPAFFYYKQHKYIIKIYGEGDG